MTVSLTRSHCHNKDDFPMHLRPSGHFILLPVVVKSSLLTFFDPTLSAPNNCSWFAKNTGSVRASCVLESRCEAVR